MVAGVNVVRSASPLPDDASIGILFVGFLSAAVVIMSSRQAATRRPQPLPVRLDHRGDVGRRDSPARRHGDHPRRRARLLRLPRRHLRRTQPRMLGLRPRLAHIGLLVLLSVAIVSSFATVGNLLVFAFLVAPWRRRCCARRVSDGDRRCGGDRLDRRRRRAADQLPPRYGGRRLDGPVRGGRVPCRPRRPTFARPVLCAIPDARPAGGTEIADSVIDVIGNTPRSPPPGQRDRGLLRAGDEDGDVEPGWFVQGQAGVGNDPAG